jgi:hypothetical protein
LRVASTQALHETQLAGSRYHQELIRRLEQAQRRIARVAGFLINCPAAHRAGNTNQSGKFASNRRLMSDRMEFEIVCPNDHNQTVTFSQEEFEAALKSGALVFHCNTCDTDWPPSSEEIAKLRKQFSKNSSQR